MNVPVRESWTQHQLGKHHKQTLDERNKIFVSVLGSCRIDPSSTGCPCFFKLRLGARVVSGKQAGFLFPRELWLSHFSFDSHVTNILSQRGLPPLGRTGTRHLLADKEILK